MTWDPLYTSAPTHLTFAERMLSLHDSVVCHRLRIYTAYDSRKYDPVQPPNLSCLHTVQCSQALIRTYMFSLHTYAEVQG